jgi:hypothetical protein
MRKHFNNERPWHLGHALRSLVCLALLSCVSGVATAQVPVDAASDRKVSEYVYFQSFGQPDRIDNLSDANMVRKESAKYFRSTLATCTLREETCSADTVYELADRYCQALEFHEAVTWRTSKSDRVLALHWVVCGFKK